MKVSEVPQDKKNINNQSVELKKVIYATDNAGNYTQTESYGWETENFALEQAWNVLHEETQTIIKEIHEGKTSPIAYYMLQNRMDIGILASYVNKWQWQVKRHLKASVFNTLNGTILQKYASVFNITVEQLKDISLIK